MEDSLNGQKCQKKKKGREELGFERRALVRGDRQGCAEVGDQMVVEDFSYCWCLHVGQRNGDRTCGRVIRST